MKTLLPNRFLLPAAVGLLAAALLASPRPMAAQQTAAHVATAAKPAKTEHDGIKVHGWWTIVVRNPDGSIAEKREFENALVGAGGQALAMILTDSVAAGNWAISLDHGASTSPPPCTASGGVCYISVTGSVFLSYDSNASSDLQVSSSAGTVTLKGSYKANQTGVIGAVSTNLGYCSAGTAPASCDASSNKTFTQKTFSSPISVTSGQTIDVTVAISFS